MLLQSFLLIILFSSQLSANENVKKNVTTGLIAFAEINKTETKKTLIAPKYL